MSDRALVKEHHDVEVDAVHAFQRGVHVPDAPGPHRADLHTDAGQAQIDREGEGPDPVPGPAFAPCTALGGSVCHVPLASTRSSTPCPIFTEG
ncbi:hypothetical protein GCM10010317_004480 [Streptomyces mirabilis]|nr:hypothetical protein GCM10010317_004480 [Streptomyces mirabilis]